jgi:drug/metabolite transporter (DMT)-like permease
MGFAVKQFYSKSQFPAGGLNKNSNFTPSNFLKLSKNLKTYLAVVLSMIFWAFSFIWYKVANESMRPVTIVFFRLVISVVLLTTYLTLTRNFMKVARKDRKLFFILATFEPFLYFIGESFGLTFISATAGSVLISTIPVFATMGAWLIFGEKLKKVNYAGIVLSFTGVLIFVLRTDGSLSFNIAGIALIMFAVISAVGYNLTLSRLVGNYSPVYIVNVQNIIGGLLFLPLFLITELRHLPGMHITFGMMIPVIKLAVFASCGAFILFAWSTNRLGITKSIVFTNFIPVFTAVFSFFILGEKLTFQNIIGMIIVISGLFLSQANGRKKEVLMDEALIISGKTA